MTDKIIEIHQKLMRTICEQIRKSNLPMALKGGTALLLCYNLDRHSEDLDFDSDKKNNLTSIVKKSATINQIVIDDFKLIKDTDTVRRYRLNYSFYDFSNKLKIETSLRKNAFNISEVSIVNNIKVYNKPYLAKLKLNAISSRTTARDFHDILFLASNDSIILNTIYSDLIRQLYENLDQTFDRFYPAYVEDDLLKDIFISDLEKLKTCHDQLISPSEDSDFDFTPVL